MIVILKKMTVILSERSESKDLRLLFGLDLKAHDFTGCGRTNVEALF